MIEIIFKNVGQGDSIILKWEKDSTSRYGIIDCNLIDKQNPVLKHIEDNDIKHIDFIILSHPHYDHFSGLSELLDNFISAGNTIGYFLHTSNNMPVFWKCAVEGLIAVDEITKLFSSLRVAKEKLNMKIHPVQGEMITGPILLNDSLCLEFLNPTTKELDNYAKNQITEPIEEQEGNKPSANWLSTVIKIFNKNDDWYILLTSDAEKSILYYNGIENRKEYKGRLVLTQIPHHGSKGNFKKSFWKKLNPNNKPIPAVISVGINKYGHPSDSVISGLSELNYKVLLTDNLLVTNGKIIEAQTALNAFSFITDNPNSVEIKFHVNQNGDVKRVF